MDHDANQAAGPGTLRFQGEMNIYSAGEAKERLMAALAASDVLEIDLSGVTEMDTAGVQLLILAKREAVRLGKRLTLSGHSPAVMDLIDLFNLGGWFGDPLIIPAGRR